MLVTVVSLPDSTWVLTGPKRKMLHLCPPQYQYISQTCLLASKTCQESAAALHPVTQPQPAPGNPPLPLWAALHPAARGVRWVLFIYIYGERWRETLCRICHLNHVSIPFSAINYIHNVEQPSPLSISTSDLPNATFQNP